jgi:hypothetical protein
MNALDVPFVSSLRCCGYGLQLRRMRKVPAQYPNLQGPDWKSCESHVAATSLVAIVLDQLGPFDIREELRLPFSSFAVLSPALTCSFSSLVTSPVIHHATTHQLQSCSIFCLRRHIRSRKPREYPYVCSRCSRPHKLEDCS